MESCADDSQKLKSDKGAKVECTLLKLKGLMRL